MNVGLRGFDRRNLGSHLMASAVVNRFPDATVALPLRAALPRRPKSLSNSAYWLWSEIGGPPILHAASAPIFERTSRWGADGTRLANISGVVDISGYIYGDPFGIGSVRRLGDWARRWSARGVPLVLLPQSIGPFAQKAAQDEMRRALQHVRIIVVRDDHSEAVVRDLAPPGEILRAPDLAIESARQLKDPTTVPGRPGLGAYALFLPNQQVLRKLDISEATYVAFLQRAAARCSAAGLQIVVGAHERGSDDEVCEALVRSVDGAQMLEVGGAPGMVGAVRDADLVISSRYHGLVAGLANGVPSIALGWASKYDDLLSEFGVPELSAPLEDGVSSDAIVSVVGDVIDDLDRLSKLLTARADELQTRLDAMWSKVIGVLSAGQS